MESRENFLSTSSLSYALMEPFEFNRISKLWLGRTVHCCSECKAAETANPQYFASNQALYLVPNKFPYAIRFCKEHLLQEISSPYFEALLKRLNVLQRIKLVRSRLESKSILRTNNRTTKSPDCLGQLKIAQVCLLTNNVCTESSHQFELDHLPAGKNMASCLAEPSNCLLRVSGPCCLLRFQIDFNNISKTNNCLIQIEAGDFRGFSGLLFCGVNIKSGIYAKLFFKLDQQTHSSKSNKNIFENNLQLHLFALRIEFRPTGDPHKFTKSAEADNSRAIEQLNQTAEKKHPANSLWLPRGNLQGTCFQNSHNQVNGKQSSTENDTSNYRFNILVRQSEKSSKKMQLQFSEYPIIHPNQETTSGNLINNKVSSRIHQNSIQDQKSDWLQTKAESTPKTKYNSLETSSLNADNLCEARLPSSKLTYFGEQEKIKAVTIPHTLPPPAREHLLDSHETGGSRVFENRRGYFSKPSQLCRPKEVLASATKARDCEHYSFKKLTSQFLQKSDFNPGFSAK